MKTKAVLKQIQSLTGNECQDFKKELYVLLFVSPQASEAEISCNWFMTSLGRQDRRALQ